jgi:hypothetical protein
MQQIPLSQNQTAIVDDEDFERLQGFRWFYRGERDGKQGYAIRHRKEGKAYKTQYLHREVVGPVPQGHEVIFRNHERLDCRKDNLAVVTITEARQHHRTRRDSKSGVKGVRYNGDTDTWSAYAYRQGQCCHFGTYASKEQAQYAYEARLREENPDLYAAPARIERTVIAGPDKSGNPGGSCEGDGGVHRLRGKGSPRLPSAAETLASMVRYSLSKRGGGTSCS